MVFAAEAVPGRIDAAVGAGKGRSRAAEEEARAWNAVESRLRRALAAAAEAVQLPASGLAKYVASATEQEIEAGALEVPDAEKHVFCFFRSISGLPGDQSARGYLDINEAGAPDAEAQARLKDLKARLRSRLGANVHEDYACEWRNGSITADHLERLCEDVWRSLSGIILGEMTQLAEMDPVDKEVSDHETFGRERARVFFGREAALRRVASYLQGEGSGPFALFGPSGSGKSALMARALEQARQSDGRAAIAARFCGATPFSSDIRALLESLCRQVTRSFGGDEASIPGEFKELVEEFPKRLAQAGPGKPLFVFLDALDQLADSHNGRNLTWLPAALPDHVRIVVSTAPSECWDVLKKRLPETGQLELQPMSSSEGGRILDAWLKDAGRTLQPGQRGEVLEKFSKNGLPLYLKFAFEEARNWKSDTVKIELEPEVDGMIRQLFARLSAPSNHGAMLVSSALAYLRAAKNGLTEDEIIDVLSRDAEVFGDFEKRAFFRPPEPKLPVVVWSRFYFDMEPYLNERSADGTSLLGFFHRQMGDVVEAEYLAGERGTRIHASLAYYFSAQPLFAVEEGRKSANLRKLSELPFQQVHGRLWDKVYETLTDFEFLEAKCTYSGIIHAPEGESGRKLYGGVYELIEDYQRALAVFPPDE